MSKVARNNLCFLGHEIMKVTEGIKVSSQEEGLTLLELRQYCKMTGKDSWLASSTQPDLCYTGLDMAQRSYSTTITDLHKVNVVLKRAREKTSKEMYCQIGEKEEV